MSDVDPVGELAGQVGALVRRLTGWTSSRYRAAALAPARGTRGDALFGLVAELARLGRQAGVAVPAGVEPARLGDHALADQISVLAAELGAAPGAGQVAADALTAVLAARAAIGL